MQVCVNMNLYYSLIYILISICLHFYVPLILKGFGDAGSTLLL